MSQSVGRGSGARPTEAYRNGRSAISDPLALVESAVRRARRVGAEQAEAYFEDRQTTGIELRNGEVETLIGAGSRGLGLRVLVGQGMAYAYSSDLRPRGLSELARQAVALARQAAPDPARGLPQLAPLPEPDGLGIFDPTLAEVPTERKIDLLKAVEQAARAVDPRVSTTEVARYNDSFGTVALASSEGLAGRYDRSMAWASLVAVARDDSQALRGYGLGFGHSFSELVAERIGQQAARRAVKPLGGRAVPTQRATVVMEPEVAAELLGQLGQALSGEAVVKGRSMLAGRLGQRIGSGLVTLVDHGSLPGGPGSAPFDGEGVPAGRTVLVEQGVLGRLLHSTYSARRAGTVSTGNAVRGGYRTGPEVGLTNLFLAAPATPRENLLADVERGLLVISTRNVGGINPVSGDYSVGASGVWLERGQETGPVAGVTIAAGILEILAGLVAVGDDFRWTFSHGAIGTPTLRIEGMTIAGA